MNSHHLKNSILSKPLHVQIGETDRTDLKRGTINPAWVLDGEPEVRALKLTETEDEQFSCGLWDCTASKFKYTFYCDEIVHILEGEVIIQEVEDGVEYTLRPGDVAFFPKGSTSYWTVPVYLKKLAIHRSVSLSLMGRVRAKLKRLVSGASCTYVGLGCALSEALPEFSLASMALNFFAPGTVG